MTSENFVGTWGISISSEGIKLHRYRWVDKDEAVKNAKASEWTMGRAVELRDRMSSSTIDILTILGYISEFKRYNIDLLVNNIPISFANDNSAIFTRLANTSLNKLIESTSPPKKFEISLIYDYESRLVDRLLHRPWQRSGKSLSISDLSNEGLRIYAVELDEYFNIVSKIRVRDDSMH